MRYNVRLQFEILQVICERPEALLMQCVEVCFDLQNKTIPSKPEGWHVCDHSSIEDQRSWDLWPCIEEAAIQNQSFQRIKHGSFI